MFFVLLIVLAVGILLLTFMFSTPANEKLSNADSLDDVLQELEDEGIDCEDIDDDELEELLQEYDLDDDFEDIISEYEDSDEYEKC